jgi:hypothetical protein
MCREDRSIAIRTKDSKQVVLCQANEQGDVIEVIDNGDPSPLNLHQTLSESKSENMMSGCNSIFTNRGTTSVGLSTEVSSRNSSFRQEATAPSHNEVTVPPTQGSKFRTGMMLLADGSIVVPEEHSNRWIQRQQRKQSSYSRSKINTVSSNPQQIHSNSSIHPRRENSLLDMLSRSGDASQEEKGRMASVRHQKRVRIKGGNEIFIIPRQTYDEEQGRGVRTQISSPDSAEDTERQNFWKQVALAATVLLLACGLIVIAISFFLPVHKMT